MKKNIILLAGLIIPFLYLILIGNPVFGTNDDVGMSLLAAGQLLSNSPTPDLLFIHYLYGELLSYLYTISPSVPWYGILFILLTISSLTNLISTTNKNTKLSSRTIYLSIILLSCTATTIIIFSHLQFTIIAGICTISGLITIFNNIFCENNCKTSKSFYRAIIPYILISIGIMIREQSALLVMLIFLPAFILNGIKFYILNQNKKLRILIPIAIICLVTVTLHISQKMHFNNNTEWANWHKLNTLKSNFIDYKKIKYNSNYIEQFKKVNWTKNDYSMIVNWLYIDSRWFPVSKFEKIAPSNITNQKNNLKKSIKILLANTINISKKQPLLFISIIILITFGLINGDTHKRTILIATTIATIFSLYILIAILGRFPYRVVILVWLTLLWISLNQVIIGNEYKPTGWKYYLKYLLLPLCLLVILSFVKNISSTCKFTKERELNSIQLKSIIDTWVNKLDKDYIVINIGDSFPYGYILPLEPFQYYGIDKLKNFISTGCNNQSPIQKNTLSKMGMDNYDFFSLLKNRENVYIVYGFRLPQKEKLRRLKKDQYRIKVLDKFYLEKYNLTLNYKFDHLPFLASVVFHNKSQQINSLDPQARPIP